MNRHPAQPARSRERWVDAAAVRALAADPGVAAIVDRRVASLHAIAAPDQLTVTAGERLKSFSGLRRLTDFIESRHRAGAREVVAIGGGTVGDAVGLAAHLVRRGLPLIMAPTTLLAAVDSSIGGKVAINGGDGVKNALGAFHFPHLTLLAPEIWSTLERRRRLEGIAEAVKMALCFDAAICETWLNQTPTEHELVHAGRRLKRAVVMADPFETRGLRQALNFGHSIGHAIEAVTRHRISHGVAVALGMRVELEIAVAAGFTDSEMAAVANGLLDRFALPGRDELNRALIRISWHQFSEALMRDKKGYLRFVCLAAIGAPAIRTVDEGLVRQVFESGRVS